MESKWRDSETKLQNSLSEISKFSEQLAKVERVNATAAAGHTGELTEMCLTWEQEKKDLLSLLSKKSKQLAEAECRVVEMEGTQEKIERVADLSGNHSHRSAMESPTSVDDARALRETLVESNLEMQRLADRLRLTNEMVENLTREIIIKDKQLDHLRGQLSDMAKTGGPSFLSMAVVASNSSTMANATPSTSRTSKEEAREELIEILEEDMKQMRAGYEKKISALEVKLEELS
jgi:hypothetical protein